MILEPIHEEREVPCPVCKRVFVPPRGASLPAPRPSGMGATNLEVLSLVLGIIAMVGMVLGWLVCPLLSVFAALLGPVGWIVARRAMREAARTPGHSDGMAQAGNVLGIINTVLLGLMLCCGLLAVAFFLIIMSANLG